MNENITAGVGRPDLDQLNHGVPNGALGGAGERRRWLRTVHSGKVERPETVCEELADKPHRGRGLQQPNHHRRALVRHFLGRNLRAQNLSADDEFVSVAVVAVAMRVDERRDRHVGQRRGEAVKHCPCER